MSLIRHHTVSEPILTNLKQQKYKIRDKATNSFIVIDSNRQPERHRSLFSSISHDPGGIHGPIGELRTDHIFLEENPEVPRHTLVSRQRLYTRFHSSPGLFSYPWQWNKQMILLFCVVVCSMMGIRCVTNFYDCSHSLQSLGLIFKLPR